MSAFRSIVSAAAMTFAALLPLQSFASSHREAPFITEMPKVDGTDFYMFTSYEAGRSEFVTLIANYVPLQDSYGGPNYFSLDPEAVYDIHIDNNGDVREDITFRFRFRLFLRDQKLTVGGRQVSVPLINTGVVGPTANDTTNLNRLELYSISLLRGGSARSARSVVNAATAQNQFLKPVDNIGNKSIPNYEAYANSHIFNVTIPGCSVPGRAFVGQRQEGFFVNLGETFDLLNFNNPVGDRSAERNTLEDKNVTSLALEVHKSCLLATGNTIIGGWTTASLPRRRTLTSTPTFRRPAIETSSFIQVSRLGMPLVNELVIGLRDKDRFNASSPRNDSRFLPYVTNPTLPALIEALYPAVQAPTRFPRTDLVEVFLTGVEGLNKTTGTGEMLRLNTAIAPVAAATQNNLGVLGGDNAGFPNGRRPADDVVDITLRAAMGALLPVAEAPSGALGFTDGVQLQAVNFLQVFPYLNTPLPGSPDPLSTN